MQATLKAPIINKTDDQVQAEQNAADTALKALEQRYANPNWFNIAAALFKPQLGGFAASLGSASQELGNWQEQQRANELPIYAARAQVGALKGQLKNRNDAAKEFEKAKAEGFSPDKLAALQARLSSLGANDLADSVNKMLEAQQKERTMSASEYSNAMSAANALYTAGNLTKAGLAAKVSEIESKYGPKPRGAAPAEVKVDAGAAAAPVAAAADTKGVEAAPVWTGGKLPDAMLAKMEAEAKTNKPGVAEALAAYKAAQVPAKPEQTYESAGAQGDSATALTKEELKNINDAYGPKITNIIANDPRVTETRSANFYRAGTLLNNPEVQAGMGQLFKEKGFAAAFKTALKEGINLAVAAPTGGWNAAISAPVDKILTAYDVNPKARQALVELNRIAMEDAIADIREGTRALGGGHTSTSEYESLMTRIANTNEPYKLMQQFFAKRAVENDFNAKAHDLWVNYTNAPGFATKPVGNFFSSPEYKKLSKEHSKNLIKAATIAD